MATPLDPATARVAESFYRFYPRTVLGGVRSAWRFERERLRRKGLGMWHPSNRMLRYGLMQAALYGAVAWGWGAAGMAFVAAQAIVAFSLLEVINYVEHYGLERRALGDGRYERVMPWHSWNSSHRVSNWLLINLARHSDHHWVAAKRYQVLEHLDAAPQLPAGYGTIFVVALVPPLWRRVMDPRVEAWRARYLTGAPAQGPGDTTLSTALARGGEIAVDTLSGELRLTLPRDVSATVTGESFSGDLRVSGAQVQRPKHGPGSSVSHRYGAGEGRITVESFSGSASVIVE